MRLNEIKQVAEGTIDLTEGVIPVHLTLVLAQVVRDGKITNNVQVFTLASLAYLFRAGGPYRWPRDINPYQASANAEMIETVRELPDAEAAGLASRLLELLQAPASYEANPFAAGAAAHLSPEDWVRWVRRRQD